MSANHPGAAAARVGDLCSGHDGFRPKPFIQGSGNVFVNGKPLVREGDTRDVHISGSSSHSSAVPIGHGSSTVKVNGLGAVRIGDHVDQDPNCLSFAAQGSGNVFIGG